MHGYTHGFIDRCDRSVRWFDDIVICALCFEELAKLTIFAYLQFTLMHACTQTHTHTHTYIHTHKHAFCNKYKHTFFIPPCHHANVHIVTTQICLLLYSLLYCTYPAEAAKIRALKRQPGSGEREEKSPLLGGKTE